MSHFNFGGWTVPLTPYPCSVVESTQSWVSIMACLAITIPARLQQIPYCCSHFPLAADSDCKCTHGYSRVRVQMSSLCFCLSSASARIRALMRFLEAWLSTLHSNLSCDNNRPIQPRWSTWPAKGQLKDSSTKRLIEKDRQRRIEKFLFRCCSRSLSFTLAEEQESPAGPSLVGWKVVTIIGGGGGAKASLKRSSGQLISHCCESSGKLIVCTCF